VENPDDLLTTAEVALITRAPVSTVRYWRYAGTGPKSFRVGRRVLYPRADVMAWLRAQEASDRARTAS
jgi:excisionase family DNA binding protein